MKALPVKAIRCVGLVIHQQITYHHLDSNQVSDTEYYGLRDLIFLQYPYR